MRFYLHLYSVYFACPSLRSLQVRGSYLLDPSYFLVFCLPCHIVSFWPFFSSFPSASLALFFGYFLRFSFLYSAFVRLLCHARLLAPPFISAYLWSGGNCLHRLVCVSHVSCIRPRGSVAPPSHQCCVGLEYSLVLVFRFPAFLCTAHLPAFAGSCPTRHHSRRFRLPFPRCSCQAHSACGVLLSSLLLCFFSLGRFSHPSSRASSYLALVHSPSVDLAFGRPDCLSHLVPLLCKFHALGFSCPHLSPHVGSVFSRQPSPVSRFPPPRPSFVAVSAPPPTLSFESLRFIF